MNKGFTLIEVLVVVAIIGILAAVTAPAAGKIVGFSSEFSAGERTGVVTKISKRGYIWKTWEGEMNLGGMSVDGGGAAVPNVWRFSVPSDDIAKQVAEAATSGKKATLVYTEVLKASFRQGDTDYLITAVKY